MGIEKIVLRCSNSTVYFRITEKDAHQWHATLFAGLEVLKPRYPINAPTATESMTQPLYVMNRSLQM